MISARWSHEAAVNFVVSSIRNILDHVSGSDFYWRMFCAFSSSATAQFTRSVLELLFILPDVPSPPSPILGDAL